MLVCYARELKEHFVDYAEQTVKLMVPMLKFYFHDGVRTAAAESLPSFGVCQDPGTTVRPGDVELHLPGTIEGNN